MAVVSLRFFFQSFKFPSFFLKTFFFREKLSCSGANVFVVCTISSHLDSEQSFSFLIREVKRVSHASACENRASSRSASARVTRSLVVFQS